MCICLSFAKLFCQEDGDWQILFLGYMVRRWKRTKVINAFWFDSFFPLCCHIPNLVFFFFPLEYTDFPFPFCHVFLYFLGCTLLVCHLSLVWKRFGNWVVKCWDTKVGNLCISHFLCVFLFPGGHWCQNPAMISWSWEVPCPTLAKAVKSAHPALSIWSMVSED